MKNQEILDDEQLNNGKEIIDKRTKNLTKNTVTYLIITAIGSLAIFYFEFKDTLLPLNFSSYKEMTIYRIIGCLLLSLILESFRFLRRKFKNKESNALTLIDPFWFQVIEGAFAIWILDTIIKIILLVIF